MAKALQSFSVLFVACLLVSAQVGSLSDDDRKALVRTSALIVVAVPERETQWIVNRPKMKATRSSSSLPNPSDYVVGELFNVRVVDILKADSPVKKGEFLKVFVSGMQVVLDRGNIVTPEEKNIFFLSMMNMSDPGLKDLGLYSPERSPEVVPFDSSTIYKPTEEVFSAQGFNRVILKKIEHDIREQAHVSPKN